MAEPGDSTRVSGRDRLIGHGMITEGDEVLLDLRPSLFMIPVRSISTILFFSVLLFMCVRAIDLVWSFWAGQGGLSTPTERTIMIWGIVLIAGVTIIRVAIDYATRRYVLTTKRAFSVVGAVDQSIGEIGLDRLESLVISKPLMARLFGLGHIRLASAGTDQFTVQWWYLRSPERIAARIREAQGKLSS